MHEQCPKCGANLKDGGYSRKLGIEIRGVYDGILYWMCPDCGEPWHRWPPGDPLRARANFYMPRSTKDYEDDDDRT